MEAPGVRPRARLIGDYDFSDMRVAVDAARADPAFRLGSSLLFDARSAYNYVGVQTIEARVQWVVDLRDRGAITSRHAFVAPAGDEYRMRVTRMGAPRLAERGVVLRIFHDMDEALTWLASLGTTEEPSRPAPSRAGGLGGGGAAATQGA